MVGGHCDLNAKAFKVWFLALATHCVADDRIGSKCAVPLTSSARQIYLSKRTRRAGGRRFRVGPDGLLPQLGIHVSMGIVGAIINATIGALILLSEAEPAGLADVAGAGS